MSSNKMAHQVQKTAGIPNGMRTATVTAITSAGVTISLNGGTFSYGVGVLNSYAPQVGDSVAVFRQDSSWLILGPSVASAKGQWVKFSSLGYQNGWSDRGTGYPYGSYRVVGAEVQIIGQITNAAVQGTGAVIVTGLPQPPGEVAGIVAAQSTSRPSLHVDTAGALRIYDSSATGLMQFSGSYPLDFPVS